MVSINGVAFAIYGRNPSKATTTVLSGDAKESITVHDTVTKPFHNPTTRAVEEIFGQLRDTVRELVTRNISLEERAKIPVVTGTSAEYNCRDLLRSLGRVYGDVKIKLSDDTLYESGSCPLRIVDKLMRRKDQKMVWIGLCEGINGIIADAAQPYLEELHIDGSRDYTSIQQQSAMASNRRGIEIGIEEIVPAGSIQEIERLLDRFESGDDTVIDNLVENAQELGRLIGRGYIVRNIMNDRGWKQSRFFSAPEDLRSRLYIVPGARNAYAAAMMSELGIGYNICVKGNRDKPSPPFSDITAAIMGDYFDEQSNTSPGVVMVNHS